MFKELSNGRKVEVREVKVKTNLAEIVEDVLIYDEESDREFWRTEVRRPQMTTETTVVLMKNKFGHIRLYGPQG